MKAPSRQRAAGYLLTLVLGSCGSSLPVPATGPHRADGDHPPTIVSYPPPAVRAECVPPQPNDNCVWVDGSWRERAKRWEWDEGSWVVPPPGCYHAPAYSQWLRMGGAGRDRLYYFEAAWYPEKPGGNCRTPRVCRKATALDEC